MASVNTCCFPLLKVCSAEGSIACVCSQVFCSFLASVPASLWGQKVWRENSDFWTIVWNVIFIYDTATTLNKWTHLGNVHQMWGLKTGMVTCYNSYWWHSQAEFPLLSAAGGSIAAVFLPWWGKKKIQWVYRTVHEFIVILFIWCNLTSVPLWDLTDFVSLWGIMVVRKSLTISGLCLLHGILDRYFSVCMEMQKKLL